MKLSLITVAAAFTLTVSASASAYIKTFPEYYGHITCHKPTATNPFNILWSRELTSGSNAEANSLIALCESQGGFAADHRT
ncbi:hypothetical protein ACSLBF_11340 [Pseudoalteromonas sp. T1lg65]|uniref:hypothetical protein n=1 Tax=Pseudoalteromonas sp. T1lg65 TaxID=2077101 RepID=UPI003F78BC1F